MGELVDFTGRNSSIGWHAWSRNGKFVYFASGGTDEGIFRIGISDPKPQKVATLKDLDPSSFALSPDDEPLIFRETSSEDICVGVGSPVDSTITDTKLEYPIVITMLFKSHI